MFNIDLFSKTLQDILKNFESITELSEKSGVNRTYLSKYINKKLDTPPSPKILEKISDITNNASYYDLLIICGYLDQEEYSKISSDSIKKVLLKNRDKLLELGLKDKDISNIYNLLYTDYEESIDFINDFNSLLDSFPEKQKVELYNLLLIITVEIAKTVSSNPTIENINNRASYPFRCPVYGRIAAGQPNWAEECIEGYLPIDPELMNITNPEECFFLRVNGESMNKKVKNGAYALIQKTDFVENGEIAVVLVNGSEATLKKFTKQGDLIILEPMSTDASFTTQVYNKDTQIRVIGKYIGKMEMD